MRAIRDHSAAARPTSKQKEKAQMQKQLDVEDQNVEDTMTADEDGEQQQPEAVEEDDFSDLIFEHMNMVGYSEDDIDLSDKPDTSHSKVLI